MPRLGLTLAGTGTHGNADRAGAGAGGGAGTSSVDGSGGRGGVGRSTSEPEKVSLQSPVRSGPPTPLEVRHKTIGRLLMVLILGDWKVRWCGVHLGTLATGAGVAASCSASCCSRVRSRR
jgi:hypothetical protein